MRRVFAGPALAVTLAFLAPPALHAQGVELGLDAEFDYVTTDPSVTLLTIPTGAFRVGFGLNRKVSFEPRVTFQYAASNGNHATLIDLQLGFPWQFAPGHDRKTFYLRPFFNYTRISGGGGSASQSGLGAGLGYKIPQGNRLAIRLEAGFLHSLENDDFISTDTIFALIGVSFYTK